MRTTLSFIASLILCFNASISIGQTADEVIQKYINASGGIEKMKAIKTEKTVVAIEQGGITFNQTIYKKRPLMFREETLIQGKTSLQIFDGKEGWTVNPFTGRETVEAMTEDDVKEMKIQADMDGELIDYAKKGFKVSYEGEEDVDGSMAYKLKLVTDKNDIINFFIDKESSYLVKQTFKQKNEDGSEVESVFSFSNFKAVEGVIKPYELEASSTYMGQVYKTPIKIVSIEVNKEMSDDLFKKPEVKN
jgi:hypothetical protein